MADFPTAAVARLGEYNGARYDAQTNPYGMAIGGHRQNFPPSLNDTAVVVNYVGAAATEIAAFAQQTADDRRQTGEDRQAAAQSAAAAATFNPALFMKRDGSQRMSGALPLAVGAGLNLGPSGGEAPGSFYDVETGPTVLQARNGSFEIFDAQNPGAGAMFSITGSGTAPIWKNQSIWHAGNAPDATDPEADALSGTARRMWSRDRIGRAARATLPLPTQPQAEAGALTTQGSWSPQRDKQAIDALAPKGVSLTGSQGSADISNTAAALCETTWIASGPAVFGVANLSVGGGTSAIARGRIQLYRNGTLFYTGPEIAQSHTANNIERLIVPFAFTGLEKGGTYVAYVFALTDGPTVSVTSNIQGLCA